MANIFDGLETFTGVNSPYCPLNDCKLSVGGVDIASTVSILGEINW